MFALPSRVLTLLASCIVLALVAGCSSSGAGYSAADIESLAAAEESAKQAAVDAAKAVAALEKQIADLGRKIERDTKRLERKNLSEKARKQAADRIEKNTDALDQAKKDLRNAERTQSRADRALRRAESATERAKRRKAAAEAREKARASSIGGGLFSRRDPALKYIKDYAARIDNDFPIAEIPVDKVAPRLFRQEVRYSTKERPGTIVVDTGAKYLYLVQRNGRAMRYGIGVGRQGFAWSGSAHIGFKRVWPKWTPPAEMIARQPELAKYCADCGGMAGGPDNPLGARALYLVKDGKDTLYRLHGTPQWQSIGTAASSGCIRLMNQDIIDLYNRVPAGTKVVVL